MCLCYIYSRRRARERLGHKKKTNEHTAAAAAAVVVVVVVVLFPLRLLKLIRQLAARRCCEKFRWSRKEHQTDYGILVYSFVCISNHFLFVFSK